MMPLLQEINQKNIMRFMVILYILGLHILLGIKNKQIGYQKISLLKANFIRKVLFLFQVNTCN